MQIGTSRGKLRIVTTARGVPQMVQDLKYMRDQIADGLQAVVHAGAAVFEEEAKALAPVRTGRLKGSIHIEIVVANSEGCLAVVAPDDSVDYAVHVEYGTKNAKEHPYMRPAFENAKDRAEAAMVEVLTSELREVLSIKGGGR